MPDRTISDVYKKIEDCQKDVNKMIAGLYGGLDAPGTGFISNTDSRLDGIERKLTVIFDENAQKNNKNQWTITTLISGTVAIFAFVKAFFFPGN